MTFLVILLACAEHPAKDGPSGEDTDSGAAEATVRVPAEWEPQAAMWLQWPRSYESSYEPGFSKIVAEILEHEDVHVLVHNSSVRASAEASLAADGGLDADVIGGAATAQGFVLHWHAIPNDNAWMRDNGPRYVLRDGELRIQDWGFDAWGGAFGRDVTYADDDDVPIAVGELLDLPVDTVDLVHERGDLEFNGTDTVLLNWSVIGDPDRNPGLTRAEAEAALQEHFGVTRVVMIEGSPEQDLTGGHIDGIARFIDENRVVVADCSDASACQPDSDDDQVYDAAAETIAAAGLEVIRFPFQTQVSYRGVDLDTDYMNWLVGNGFVIAVGFDEPDADAAAKAQLEAWFPDREVTVIELLESWYAGGGVHCHTNDQPAG